MNMKKALIAFMLLVFIGIGSIAQPYHSLSEPAIEGWEQMVEIKPLASYQCDEVKKLILKAFYATWQPHESYDQFSREIYQSDEFHDVDNFKEIYSKNRSIFVVLTDQDKIIGSGAIKQLNDLVCELKRMVVSVECQRRGFGSQLLQKLLDFARSQGYEKVRLEIWQPKKQKAAVLFYKKFGFYEIEPYISNSEGRLFMEKILTKIGKPL